MSFSEHYTADFRLAILEVLVATEVDVTLPVLRSVIEEMTQHRPSLDLLVAEVIWLGERGLVKPSRVDGVVTSAVILPRGDDVVQGRLRVGGVAAGEPRGDDGE